MSQPMAPLPPDAMAVAMRLASTASDVPFGLVMVQPVADGVPDFEIRWLNQSAADALGPASAQSGARLRRDLAGLVDPALIELLEQAQQRRRVTTGEVDQVDDDDDHRRLRCVLLPVEDGTVVVMDDVTEHHRARGELATAERKLAQLQEWGRVGFWELDIAADTVYFSTQAFEIIGLTDASLDAFLDVVHPDDLELIHHIISRARAQAGPYRATHRTILGDEVRMLQQTMQSVAGDDGRPARLLGIVTDVTVEQALEDRMQRASAQQSIGLLAGGMVHDLNNTFSVVHGHAQLALAALERGDAVDRLHFEAIGRSVESGRALTRQLLSLGREHTLHPRRFSPVDLLDRTAVVARATLGSRRSVELDLGDAQIDLIADLGGVERVLVDLVINARDALPADGGTVCIGLRGVVLDGDSELVVEGSLAPGFYAEVTVRDDGCGMDEETLDRAFEPFFSTKPSGQGSGVGLAAAEAFARHSAGGLVVTSAPSEGTCVSLILPAVPVMLEAGPRRDRPRRVLVVAADPQRAARLQHAFAATSAQTVVATSLGAAVTVLRTEPIDLVVSDATIGVPLEASPTWRRVAEGTTLVMLSAPNDLEPACGDSVILLEEPDTDEGAAALAADLLAVGLP